MSEPKSYWLPSGELIFVYDTQAAHYPPWIIAKERGAWEKSILQYHC